MFYNRMGLRSGLSLLLLFFASASCCGINLNYGDITKDTDIKVNDILRLQCNLFNLSIVYENQTYSVSSKDLFLKFNGEFLKNVDVLDDHTIEYSVETAHEDDSGTYSCYLALPEINKNALVCSTSIAVGYEPQPVENFTCISYEYSNLTCSWVKPFNPVHTNYKLWDYIGFEAWKRPCPEVLNDTSCRWTRDTRVPYRVTSEKLYFIITGNNSLGESKQYMVQDHFKIVKPGIPRNVMILNVTETSMVIHWSPPKYMEYQAFAPGLEYSIQYKPVSRGWDLMEITDFTSAEGAVFIDNLIPHTAYHFSIRCRSTRVDNDDFWSPSATAVEETKPDVPYLAPEMTTSSFDVENLLGNRTVTVYWKGVPSAFENGDKFHYVVQFHLHHVLSPSRTVRDSYELDVGHKTFHSFPHLDSHSAYIFKVYAVNNMGPSLNSSSIVIDKADKLLENPEDITVISNGFGKFNLSWKASNQRPYNFTVYWCKTVKTWPAKCDGPLEWMYTTKTKHILQLPDRNSNYQFAVSANDEGRTSGMSWAPCIVNEGANYNVRRVELLPKNATSLRIQWSLECEAQKIVMREYAIHYCEFQGPCSQNNNVKSCSDWKVLYVSDVSLEDYVLGSLKPYTYYMSFLKVRNLNDWSGISNVACEMTMSTAPSDPPQNVKVVNIDGKYITVSFEAPEIPNGVISRYIAYYNKTDGTSHHQEFRMKEIAHEGNTFSINLVDFMAYYTNYSIELAACVDQACSEKSQPVYAFTSISYPDIVSVPRIEVMENMVNVTWECPVLSNGPLDYFQILMEGHNSSKVQIFNVTGQNFLDLHPNCSENKDDAVYNFRVRAVNIRNNSHLYGRYSNPAKSQLCSGGASIAFTIGIAVGGTVGIILMLLILFNAFSWLRKQVESARNIQIQLPKDLESPMENPLSSYDKFKNGLQPHQDSGIPCDTSYERLFEFAQENGLGTVTEENAQKQKRKSSGRNNSGESTASGKCHDSISSSNTTKTHLSIDSGAEVDSPPSPDGLFSDTSSVHTTPRSYKPDLTIVQEGSDCTSKDSGLEREGTCPFMNHQVHFPSKFAYFVKKKNYPCSNIQISNGSVQIPHYSKVAVLGATNSPPFVPYGEQNMGLLEQQSLSNSEPSVADFDVGNGSEPLMPYCKFGLARSAGNGLNMSNQPLSINPKTGYSKFGTVFRALKRQDSNTIPHLNDSLQSCPKFLPHNPQTFTALTVSNHPQGKQPLIKDNDKAYSKFGVSAPKNIPVNGYIFFKDILSYPSADSGANQAYSKLGMSANKTSQPENDHPKENGVIISAAELQAMPHSSQNTHNPLENTKDANNPFCKQISSASKSEVEQPIANHKVLLEKDNSVEEDKDCVVPDSSTSLLDDINPDLSNKLKPTNFTISASNDAKGFMLQDDSINEPATQLTNFIDAVFDAYDFHIPDSENSIDMEELNIPSSDPEDCEHTCNLVTRSNGCIAKDLDASAVLCNGHSSPLPNLSTDYVPVHCNPAC